MLDMKLYTRSGDDGFYIFHDLPHRCGFELAVENGVDIPRGRSVYTSSDCWDWDLVVGTAPDGGSSLGRFG